MLNLHKFSDENTPHAASDRETCHDVSVDAVNADMTENGDQVLAAAPILAPSRRTNEAFPRKWYLTGGKDQVLTSRIQHEPYPFVDVTTVPIVHTGAEPTSYWINVCVIVSPDVLTKLKGYAQKKATANNPDPLKSLADLQAIEVEVNVNTDNGMVTSFKSVCSLLSQACLLPDVPIALRAHQQIKLDKGQKLQLVLKPMIQIKQAGGLRILWVEMANAEIASDPGLCISMVVAQATQNSVQSSVQSSVQNPITDSSSKSDDIGPGPVTDPNPGRWYLARKNKEEVTASQTKSDPYVVDKKTRFTIDVKGGSGLRWIIIRTSFSKSTLDRLDAVRKEVHGPPIMQMITVDVAVDKKELK
ncbi:hypothetical protein BGZ70_003142, partial [Mortierella alpina]